jgi:hypothetical protein
MTLTPEALDRATKTRDQAEEEIAAATERTDGIDAFTLVAVIADFEGESLMTTLRTNRLVRELLGASQSNYEESYEALETAAQIEDHMQDKELEEDEG